MKKELKCHVGIGPKVEGIALVASDNFSARYDLDRINGVLAGLNISYTVQVIKMSFLY